MPAWFLRWLRWLLERLGLLEPPDNAVNLELRMSTLSWILPTPGIRQRPLSHTIVEARVAGGEWGVMNPNVPFPEAELVLEDLTPADWEFRVIVVDAAGEPSPEPWPTITGTLSFLPPSNATGLTFTP